MVINMIVDLIPSFFPLDSYELLKKGFHSFSLFSEPNGPSLFIHRPPGPRHQISDLARSRQTHNKKFRRNVCLLIKVFNMIAHSSLTQAAGLPRWTREHEEKILSNGAKIQVINGRVVSFVLQKHSSVWHTQKNYTKKICCI